MYSDSYSLKNKGLVSPLVEPNLSRAPAVTVWLTVLIRGGFSS